MSDSAKPSTSQRIFRVGALYDGSGGFWPAADVFIADGVIIAVQDRSDTSCVADSVWRHFRDAEVVELPESIMLPGLINSHQHFYSSLSRGMKPQGSLDSFPEILRNLWWRLDRALDPDGVAISARVAMLEGVKHGCTRIIDHHSSPSAVRGSLEAIAREAKALNLTTVLCYECSDRNGEQNFRDACEENLEFAERHRADPLCRGMLGLHASFTLSHLSLSYLSANRPAEVPVHVHVAEDLVDVRHARDEGFEGPAARLAAHGLLDGNSLLVHGVHLSASEIQTVAAAGCWTALNAESNAHNRVGYSDPGRLRPDRILLGTDGMSADPVSALKFSYLMQCSQGESRRELLDTAEAMLFRNPARYLSGIFGRSVGTVTPGETADFAVFPYGAATDLHADNLLAHVLYGLANQSLASWVYANGQAVLEAGRFRAVNEAEVYAQARDAAGRCWSRYQEMPES
jgi:cytosine/adenosine deaminase-related metal-dependent hydrolase